MKCHQQKLCVGFNFLFDAKEFEINCQITNRKNPRNIEKLASEGKWTFYETLVLVRKKKVVDLKMFVKWVLCVNFKYIVNAYFFPDKHCAKLYKI